MGDTVQVLRWAVENKGEGIVSGSVFAPYLPSKESFSARLEEVVTRLDLLTELLRVFPVKRPVRYWSHWWFVFWMASPLSKDQCTVLLPVFTELSRKSPRYRDDITPFLAALQAACDTDAILRVELPPPGHCDLGWSTIFPHCPRCKAEAELERWQERYSDSLVECPVCGELYSPAQMASATPDEADSKTA